MKLIQNPILPGFNPDPSIIRVGDDYYIAMSTFEWFPGVQIYHSRDLKNWRLAARPLNRVSQLDMKGNPTSGGVFAPCLSYDNGTYYLVYTDVKNMHSMFNDTHNYLVTTNDICGDWSDPVYLNGSGFDPSLFHDEDGRKWLVNMVWDYRKGKKLLGGILLQEYCPQRKQLVGEIVKIFDGTSIGNSEGPHIYKSNGYYYLIVAEGGTWYNHAVTMARAEKITGPYEVHPCNPILTSRDDDTLELQKAGHADLVETQNGEWYMVHLCGRPIGIRGNCVMGRETAIQKVIWKEDGWMYLSEGYNKPSVTVQAPDISEYPFESEPVRDDFDSETLNNHFQTLRVPLGEDALSLTERPGFLRLKGKDSLGSNHYQSLVARRQQSFCFTATTCIEFDPNTFQQMAGLVCFYDTENFYYLRISRDEDEGKCIGIVSCNCGKFDQPLEREVSIEGWVRCYLKAEVRYEKLQFYYSENESDWRAIGPVLDYYKLSDDYILKTSNKARFTGAFVGLCCQDLASRNKYADFDFFEYLENEQ